MEVADGHHCCGQKVLEPLPCLGIAVVTGRCVLLWAGVVLSLQASICRR